MTKSICV